MLDDTDTVLITLNHLFNETNALYSKIAAELDLPESSFYVLYTLSVLATGSVYGAMFNEISAVNVILRRGFVSLQRAPDSKRKKTVCLTKMGTDFVIHNILPL